MCTLYTCITLSSLATDNYEMEEWYPNDSTISPDPPVRSHDHGAGVSPSAQLSSADTHGSGISPPAAAHGRGGTNRRKPYIQLRRGKSRRIFISINEITLHTTLS